MQYATCKMVREMGSDRSHHVPERQTKHEDEDKTNDTNRIYLPVAHDMQHAK